MHFSPRRADANLDGERHPKAQLSHHPALHALPNHANQPPNCSSGRRHVENELVVHLQQHSGRRRDLAPSRALSVAAPLCLLVLLLEAAVDADHSEFDHVGRAALDHAVDGLPLHPCFRCPVALTGTRTRALTRSRRAAHLPLPPRDGGDEAVAVHLALHFRRPLLHFGERARELRKEAPRHGLGHFVALRELLHPHAVDDAEAARFRQAPVGVADHVQ
mmetsp:Transcript_33052/g.67609  ORF Transcript_33052/g.67609 Transcript_33052/m.67609 type:complete len:219 (-) Transcript_33052:147-803(-)